jgi:hypothetical protein
LNGKNDKVIKRTEEFFIFREQNFEIADRTSQKNLVNFYDAQQDVS